MCAGLYPNVSAREEGISATALGNLKQSANVSAKSNPAWYDGKREVHIHPSSINSDLKAFQYPFLVFLEKVCIFMIFYSEKITFDLSDRIYECSLGVAPFYLYVGSGWGKEFVGIFSL